MKKLSILLVVMSTIITGCDSEPSPDLVIQQEKPIAATESEWPFLSHNIDVGCYWNNRVVVRANDGPNKGAIFGLNGKGQQDYSFATPILKPDPSGARAPVTVNDYIQVGLTSCNQEKPPLWTHLAVPIGDK